MNRIIIKTKNNSNEKCKTYVYDYENSIIFHKFTLILNNDFTDMIGGESIVKMTENYTLTFHRFSIKKTTLFESLLQLKLLTL